MKNVRQTLTMAAITGVLATAPLTLSNATAFAANDVRWDPNTVGAPFQFAGSKVACMAPTAVDSGAPSIIVKICFCISGVVDSENMLRIIA